jgi:hypothetical protein
MGFWRDVGTVLGLPEPPPDDYQAVADHLRQRLREEVRADGYTDPSVPPYSPVPAVTAWGPPLPSSGAWGGPLPGPVGLQMMLDPRALAGGRLTWDDQYMMFGAGANIILPPPEAKADWRMLNADEHLLRRLPTDEVITLLADASPDVSRALWDFLRLSNPGWEAKAFYPGTDRPMPAGQKLIDDFMNNVLKNRHGSPDVVINRMFFGAYLRGALFGELVLDEDGRTPIDLATPDPWTVRFQRWVDPVMGQVWVPGQFHGAQFVALLRPTIRYVPIDPAPGMPYGRSPVVPAIFSSLFLLGLLHDLRRVVAQQGYPRLDISIMLDQLRAAMPPTIAADPAQWKAWVENTVNEVKAAYQGLQPDDAFIHTSVVEINRAVGAANENGIGELGDFIGVLERMTARALKTMPIMMGGRGAASEMSDANRQWEIEVAGIKAVQHLCESMLEQLLTVGVVEAQGVAADVQFRFAELRAAEMFRDEQTLGIKLDNAYKMWAYGYASEDESANHALDHAADSDAPVAMPLSGLPYDLTVDIGKQAAKPPPAPVVAGPNPNTNRPNKPGPGAPDNKDVADSQDKGDNTPAAERAGWLRLSWPRWNRPASRQSLPMETAGAPMTTVPGTVSYDSRDQRELLRVWDEAMPAYAGLLDARLMGAAPEPVALEPAPEAEQPAPIRATAEVLLDIAQQMRELVVEVKGAALPPTAAPPPATARVTRKKVERDEEGRITSVIEVEEDAAV